MYMKASYTIAIMIFFFFKQKTAYELLRSDWSSDVCSSDLAGEGDEEQGGAAVQGGGGRDHLRSGDRKSVVEGKSVSVRVDLGGRRPINRKITGIGQGFAQPGRTKHSAAVILGA